MSYDKLSYEDAITKAISLADIDISKMCRSRLVRFLKQMIKPQEK